MAESDISKNTAADHHGKHHGTIAPEADSDDSDIRITESTHEDEEHGHSQEAKQPMTRRTTMQTKFVPTLAALVVIIGTIFGSAETASAVSIQQDINNDIACNITVDRVIVDAGIQRDINAVAIGNSIEGDRGIVGVDIIS